MSEWLPIETFPEENVAPVLVTDGVDVYWADIVELECDLTRGSVTAYKVPGEDGTSQRKFRLNHPFTHWMPLPEPPGE